MPRERPVSPDMSPVHVSLLRSYQDGHRFPLCYGSGSYKVLTKPHIKIHARSRNIKT